MAKKIKEYTAFFEGIADFNKTGGPASYARGRSVDTRTDTRSAQLLPRTLKESATVITDLPKWIIYPPTTCNQTFIYGDTGNFYIRDTNGNYTFQRQIPNSHGNGLGWFGEDNFMYYTSDTKVGRYGPVCGSAPTFVDDFFGSQGGIRTNTNSLELLRASSQYASATTAATLEIAGNLSLEQQIYPYTLPAATESYTLQSKWNENGNLRSYKFDIVPVSNYFGNGSDGALTISADTTDAPIDSACSGTIGENTLTATNASFSVGQVIYIHQTQGTGAGAWQKTSIQAYTAGTITTSDTLNFSYSSSSGNKAQVLVMKQYTNVTVNSGKTWSAKTWNGTTGGILAFLANGTITVPGTINASGKGFRGGAGVNHSTNGIQGEGQLGAGTTSTAANGQGGGGGGNGGNFAAGGGGNGTAGNNFSSGASGGFGGELNGTTDLTTMLFGGGGGSGANFMVGGTSGAGGTGGGIIFASGITVTVTGSMVSDGTDGGNPIGGDGTSGSSGGGAGGSILLKAQIATLGTNLITTNGGSFGTGTYFGGVGGTGRIHLDYFTSFTGTTIPTSTSLQDNSLGSTSGVALRLQLSSNGTAVETYQTTVLLPVNTWSQVAVSWTASTSTAEFFINGNSQGIYTGAVTSLNTNASRYAVGAYYNGSGTATGFFNGLIDEVRAWQVVQTSANYIISTNTEVLVTTGGLNAYYKFNSTATDSSINGNNLTLTNTPLYSVLVPFFGATTPLNIDQTATTAGFTYTLPTTISESATNRLTFTPDKDPQIAIAVYIDTVGTGNWTLTVHDHWNDVIASVTVLNANLGTGLFTFNFATEWNPVINQNYHFHLTSTVADGKVRTGTASDLETVTYTTYYGFLITDTQFHPVLPMLQFLCFGNDRYVATLQSQIYDPNTIALPAGWKVRCFAYWNEYLAIGAWRGERIDQFDQGRIFFWDGVSLTYNFFIDVPEGAVNAMLGTRGLLYFFAGSRGKLMVYEGAARARRVKNLINSETNDVIDIFPGAMTMWRTLLRIGVAGNNQDNTLQRGVYTWGAINERYPDSLSFDHVISTGGYQGGNVLIGAVAAVDAKLLIGWKDGTGYGVDAVSLSNPVYPTGTLEFLIEDEGAMYHQKQNVTITTQFTPLLIGQSLALKYKLDRNESWTYPPMTIDNNTSRSVIATRGNRLREYEIGVDFATTVATSPKVFAVSAEIEELEPEKRVG